MPKCRAIRAAYNSRAATVQLGCSYRAATPLPTHRHQGNRCFGWSDVPGYRCVDGDCGKEASRVAISVDLLRRDVEFFLFQPLIAMLMFGAIFCLAVFRQAAPRAAGVVEGSRAAARSEDRGSNRASPRKNGRTFLQIGEEIMDDEMRREFSKLYDALIHVGAKNDSGWISLAFTVNYVLLGIILWRLFG